MSQVLNTLSGVDVTTDSSPVIYVCPSDKKVIIEYVVARCTAANTVSDPPEIGASSTSGTVAEQRKLYGFTAVDKAVVFDTGGGSGAMLNEDDALRIDITASTAVSQEADFDVIGYDY